MNVRIGIVVLVVGAALGAAAGVSCGGGTPSTTQTPGNASASGTTAASSGSLLNDTQGGDDQLFAAAKAAPAATLVPSGPGDDALGQGIKDNAAKNAPGMQPDGPMAKATLQEDGHAQTSITLHGGKCYAIVGFATGVADFDLNVFDPAGIASYQDQTDDNHPAIGKPTEPLCPASDQPITYLLDLFSDKGGGEAAVQVYSKPK